jgi:flagellar basal-body rod modification protein FlgD
VTTTEVAATANLASITRTSDAKPASLPSQNMGKQDFLRLFTAQLNNQDPTDPVKNEAFVAQLAQFSQLEATTNMSTAMDSLVGTLSGNQIMTAAALIGRSVTASGSGQAGTNPTTGTVTGVSVTPDSKGTQLTLEGGATIPLSSVTAVSN